MNSLCAMFPGASPEFIRHVWVTVHGRDMDAAANWLIDNSAVLQEKEAEWRSSRRERALLVARVGHETPTLAKTTNVYRPPIEESSGIRYRDGAVVASRGEKYIEVKESKEWDGGSRGRVKSKGKRGKGWT